jgi:flagella basal body P-ring formation protein FlgA
VLLALCFVFFAFPAHADDRLALSTVEQHVLQALADQPGVAHVDVGPMPGRQLPTCTKFRAFTPNGTRLIGTARIGLSCLAPTRWQVYVPVQIRIETNYLAAARPLASGEVLSSADFTVASGDLADLPRGVLIDPADAVGRAMRFSLAEGQPLRHDVIVEPNVVKRGQSVKLIFYGPGFTATNEGQALGNAAEGQMVQVKTTSNTIVSGTAQADGTVRVGPAP